jgi:hypothetical protein
VCFLRAVAADSVWPDRAAPGKVNARRGQQAKGVLMHIYRIDSTAAFDLLKWRSQETNIKLRALAEQLLTDVRTLGRDDELASYRSTFDRLLLTIHQRVKATDTRNRRP